jgi:hypothetical protein
MSKNPSLKEEGGGSTAEPNPDTTKYHEDEAKMIRDVAVQHMQGWRGAIIIHDERECDECVTERDKY